MKYLLYAVLIVAVAPVQVVLFDRLAVGGIHPDLALIAVCLIGLQTSELDAIAVGLVLGFNQDLFSGGLHWENFWLKPLVGLLAGLASRNVMNLTVLSSAALLMALSIFSGSVMFIIKSVQGPGVDFFPAAQGIILPQAVYDTVIGVPLLKLIQYWRSSRARLAVLSYE